MYVCKHSSLTDTSATHNWGQLWDNQNHRNNRQSMTIGDQSMPIFHDEFSHRIHIAMGSIGHPCSTIQGSAWYLSLLRLSPFSTYMPFVYYIVGPTIIISGLD